MHCATIIAIPLHVSKLFQCHLQGVFVSVKVARLYLIVRFFLMNVSNVKFDANPSCYKRTKRTDGRT